MKFLKVKNWEKFQARGKTTKYIRLHASLLDDPAFMVMDPKDRADLILVWLIAGQHDGYIPYDSGQLRLLDRRIYLMHDEGEVNWNQLIKTGWLEVVDSVGGKPKAKPGPKQGNLLGEQGIDDDTDPDEIAVDEKNNFRGLAQKAAARWKELGITPDCRSLSNARKKAIIARARQHGADAVMLMVEQRAKSKWLTDQRGKGGVGTFDWCFRDTYFPKIVEGGYIDGDQPSGNHISFHSATASQMFHADQACNRRGLRSDRMTNDQRVEIYNAETDIVDSYFARHEPDERWKTASLTEKAEVYKNRTGKWPHE